MMNKRKDCYRCQMVGAAKAIVHLEGIGRYDVAAAVSLAKRKRRRPECLTMRGKHRLDRFALAAMKGVHEEHVEHVNIRRFGVIGMYKNPGGRIAHAFLLDGNHRAVKCYRRRRTFKVYVLTYEETQSVFLGKRAPKGMRFVMK